MLLCTHIAQIVSSIILKQKNTCWLSLSSQTGLQFFRVNYFLHHQSISKGELKSLLKLSVVLIGVERIIFVIIVVFVVFDSSSSGRSHKSH